MSIPVDCPIITNVLLRVPNSFYFELDLNYLTVLRYTYICINTCINNPYLFCINVLQEVTTVAYDYTLVGFCAVIIYIYPVVAGSYIC